MYHLVKKRHQKARLEGGGGDIMAADVESHFCFMDGDSKIGVDKQTLIDRLSNETERQKIVVLNYRNAYSHKTNYLMKADGNLNCFSSDYIDEYLPYSSNKDHQAWYLSQIDLIIRANIFVDPFPFKLYSDILIRNPAHNNEYPRDGEMGGKELIDHYRAQGFSEGCPPIVDVKQQTGTNLTCELNGKLLFSFTFNETHIYGHYPHISGHY